MPLSYPTGTLAEHRACRDGARSRSTSATSAPCGSTGPDAFDRLQARADQRPRARSARAGRSTPTCSTRRRLGARRHHRVVGRRRALRRHAQRVQHRAGASTPSAATTSPPSGPSSPCRARGPAPARPRSRPRRPTCRASAWRAFDVAGRRRAWSAGTGYTGEDGVECAVPGRGGAARSGRRVLDAGVTPAGLGRPRHAAARGGPAAARPRARPRHHAAAGRARAGWSAGTRATSGAGRRSRPRRSAGVARRLRGLERRGPAAAPGRAGRCWSTASAVGEVTSGNFSPDARSRASPSPSCRPTLEPGAAVEVDVRGTPAAGRRRQAAVRAAEGASLMGHYVPHTDAEIAEMLGFIGPVVARRAVRRRARGAAPGRRPRHGAGPERARRARPRWSAWPARNRPRGPDLVCFAGGGAYDHEVPAGGAAGGVPLRVRHRLHAVPARGRPGRAAGAVRVPDADQPARRRRRSPTPRCTTAPPPASRRSTWPAAATGRPTVWVSRGVHPNWREVMRTFAAGTGHELVDVPLADGVTAWPRPAGERAGARRSSSTPTTSAASRTSPRPARVADRDRRPAARGLRPGGRRAAAHRRARCGADVVVGEGQPFGTPLSLRRPVPRAVRLPPGARAPPAGPAGGRDGRRRGPPGLRHDAADAGAGHPPGEGVVATSAPTRR